MSTKLQKKTFQAHSNHHLEALKNATETQQKLMSLSSHYIAIDDTKNAIETLQKIDQNSKEYNIAQQMIARCFFEQSRFDLADQIYSRIIKQTNEHTTIKRCLYWKGLSHLLLSNDKEALQSFETISTYDQNYLSTTTMIDQLRKK